MLWQKSNIRLWFGVICPGDLMLSPLNHGASVRRLLMLSLCFCSARGAWANVWQLQASDEDLKRIADGMLTLMAFTVLPDVTTNSLSIENPSQNDPGLVQTTLGGGFTVSDEFPVYLEGNLGWTRFDPAFIATDGTEQRKIGFKWNSFSVTGGIGWDFPIDSGGELRLRPILNFMFGRTTTDTAIAAGLIGARLDESFDIVKDARMDSYGLGGALMLDYERFRDDYEIDLEMRYSNIQLRTTGDSSTNLQGDSENNTLGLWARWRAPTGLVFLQRPLRYVLETSHTRFFGDQRGALGFDYLTSLGVGVEVDSTAYTEIVTRTRLVGRYMFGSNVNGYSVGLAVSF